jgi:chloramphenicol O-acetyltransferase type A
MRDLSLLNPLLLKGIISRRSVLLLLLTGANAFCFLALGTQQTPMNDVVRVSRDKRQIEMKTKTIDLSTWARRSQFEHFNQYESPHFNVVADVDIGGLLRCCKSLNLSSYAAVIYLVSKVSNSIEEFRYRIRGDQVVLHDVVNPSFTVMAHDETFSYCSAPYHEQPSTFFALANERMERAKQKPTLDDGNDGDHYLYMSCLPWVKFTSVSHAMRINPTDSIPRYSWGKYSKEGDTVMMPLAVQVHHALADGLHVGQFFQRVEAYLQAPETLLLE